MLDGLWTVEFTLSRGFSGSGVFVLSNNRLLGGDYGYYYSGNYNVTDKNLTGNVNVIRYDPNIISVFGNIDHFSLIILSGKVTEDNSLDAVACLSTDRNKKIQLKCRKKEDL